MKSRSDETTTRRAGVALGSNLGTRRQALEEARRRLLGELGPGNALLASAPLYESDPVDCPEDSPPFLNSVLLLGVTCDEEELLDIAQAVERAMGRPQRRARNAPRVIDIDLLFFGDVRRRTDRLTLPHPRLHLRRFVLQPLVDVAPDVELPDLGRAEPLLARMESDERPLRRVADCW